MLPSICTPRKTLLPLTLTGRSGFVFRCPAPLVAGAGAVSLPPALAAAALRAGAYALLLKSFRPEELRTTVRQALVKVAQRRERDQLERRYRALVGAADVVVVAIDRDGHAALVNIALCVAQNPSLTSSDASTVGGSVALSTVLVASIASRLRASTAAYPSAFVRTPPPLFAMPPPPRAARFDAVRVALTSSLRSWSWLCV
jgi:NAD(P)H-dependent flavin oxidoreductase YrpB (nitropropane dioxygenase family)